jgi:hypothetical protein
MGKKRKPPKKRRGVLGAYHHFILVTIAINLIATGLSFVNVETYKADHFLHKIAQVVELFEVLRPGRHI